MKCKDCGSRKLDTYTARENTDADGYRGVERTYVECQECGWCKVI